MTDEERKERNRERQARHLSNPVNLEKKRARCREYARRNKERQSKAHQLRRKTVDGRLTITYNSMTSRVNGKCTKNPEYYIGKSVCSKEEFVNWSKNDPSFIRLFEAWLESGQQFSMSPSIDRIDSDKGYDIGNMQWLTVSENGRKGAENSTRWE